MARVFISFVGLGKPTTLPGQAAYDTAIYSWKGPSSPTPFAQVAMVERFGTSYWDRLVFLCTEQSRRRHEQMLRDDLARVGVESGRLIFPKDDVPTEMTAENQWGWFELLLQYVDQGDGVTFDFTHGMRAVPIVFSSALGFLERSKSISIEHVLYGWYDKERPASEPHPIVDMREFFVINSWADAVGRLTEDADARKLGTLARESQVATLRGLGEPRLIESFSRMTDAIRNVDVNNISDVVSDSLAIVQQKRESSGGTARLLLDCVWEKFSGLAFEHPLSGCYDEAYFASQIKIVQVLLEHQLYMQAFTAIRECIASIGMIGLPHKYQRLMSTNKGRGHRRRFAELFANMIQFQEGEWDFEERDLTVAEDHRTLLPWYQQLKHLGVVRLLKEIAERQKGKRRLFDYRNGFDHAWTSQSVAFSDIPTVGKAYLASLEQCVELLKEADAFKWQSPSDESSSPSLSFLNLSNHPLPTWSADQLEGARGLGLGEPVEMEGGMPLAPPEADEAEIERLAQEVADRAVEQGAAGAFVASDFTFAFALVRELTRRGVRCFSATTERIVRDQPLPDGNVEKRTIFRFVRWREYA